MTRETKTITVVNCIKLGQELPALDRPPFPGPLGRRRAATGRPAPSPVAMGEMAMGQVAIGHGGPVHRAAIG